MSKKITLGFATIAIVLSVAVMPMTASALSHTSAVSNMGNSYGVDGIGDLFVLDRLFNVGGSGTNLGDLFILGQLFGTNGIVGNGIGSSHGNGINGLGDLFVLDRLFNVGGSGTNLGDLFILDQLFGGINI